MNPLHHNHTRERGQHPHKPMPPLMSNTLWMVSTHLLRLILRLSYFVMLTRALGSYQYGAFVGATALVSLCYPLVSMGMGNLLIKNVARDRSLFGTYWGNSLLVIAISGGLLVLILLPLSRLVLPASIPMGLVALVAITDLLLAGTIDVAGKAFQSIAWLSHTGMLLVSVNLARVIAAAVAIRYFPDLSALDWGLAYLLSTAAATLFALVMVTHDIGRPHLAPSKMRAEAAEGICFTLSMSSQKLYTQVDKVMLARLATLEMTGTYSAASRLIEVSLIPVQALMQAAYPRFFAGGANGIRGGIAVARRLLPITVALGFLASLGVYLLAGLAPVVLGDEYITTVAALRWLCPLPLLRAIYLPASDTLSGAGFQGTRCSLLGVAAGLNILANLWLIPLYAWKGAAWAAIGADAFLAVALWIVIGIRCGMQDERKAP